MKSLIVMMALLVSAEAFAVGTYSVKCDNSNSKSCNEAKCKEAGGTFTASVFPPGSHNGFIGNCGGLSIQAAQNLGLKMFLRK